ncbi:MAG: OmpA family protein [Hyphomicrobiaceae bacterium]|nr:MAG: OmpA family protein [Hyphomicrobiaceae bacterium]
MGLASLPALAQQAPPTEQQILEKLKSKSATRGLKPQDAAQTKKENDVIRELARKSTRGLLKDDRTKIAAIAEKRPAVDLEIYFDFNSAEITPKAVPALTALGKALSDAAMKDAMLLVAGHTDGKGTANYNQSLSERRAATIKAYLVREFKLTDDKLMAVGFGFERLKNKANPNADENRRVQVVNFGRE